MNIVENMNHLCLFRQLRNERTSILFYLYTTSCAWKSGKMLRILAACILNVASLAQARAHMKIICKRPCTTASTAYAFLNIASLTCACEHTHTHTTHINVGLLVCCRHAQHMFAPALLRSLRLRYNSFVCNMQPNIDSMYDSRQSQLVSVRRWSASRSVTQLNKLARALHTQPEGLCM